MGLWVIAGLSSLAVRVIAGPLNPARGRR